MAKAPKNKEGRIMAIYAYADETAFQINKTDGIEAVGYSIFMCRKEITGTVIEEAMQSLKTDPDFDQKLDGRTVMNGFFHASFDSANAHSHLCNSIRKYCAGRFDFTYHKSKPKIQSTTGHVERLLHSCLSQSTMEFFHSLEDVHLIVEGRDEIGNYQIHKWREDLYRLFEGVSYDQPYYKTYFPKITIEIGDKKVPGLQVVDFLSWSASRYVKQRAEEKYTKWFKRLKFTTTSSETTEGLGLRRVSGYLSEKMCQWLWDYPQSFTEPETHEDILRGYVIIERSFCAMDRSDFTDDNLHLFGDFEKAKVLCQSLSDLDNAELSFIAGVFIRLFDSLPIYSNLDDGDRESWRMFFYAKRVASLLVRDDQINMVRTQDMILSWRQDYLSAKREQYLKLIQA